MDAASRADFHAEYARRWPLSAVYRSTLMFLGALSLVRVIGRQVGWAPSVEPPWVWLFVAAVYGVGMVLFMRARTPRSPRSAV